MQFFLNRRTGIDKTLHSCCIRSEDVHKGRYLKNITLFVWVDGIFVELTHSSKLYLLQTSIVCMKWDPTGHMLLTCAEGDSHVKVWMPGREGLTLLHDLSHNSAVTHLHWCSLLGKGDNPYLLLAR